MSKAVEHDTEDIATAESVIALFDKPSIYV